MKAKGRADARANLVLGDPRTEASRVPWPDEDRSSARAVPLADESAGERAKARSEYRPGYG